MKNVPRIDLPPGYPWGIAILDLKDGRVLNANDCMREVYGCEVGDLLSELCAFANGEMLTELSEGVLTRSTWAGRIHPKKSRHGITSVEIMLQRDPDRGDLLWLYTLEHPRVRDQVRFSSRSELKMLRVLLDNTLEYVFFRDIEGHFILTNRAFHDRVFDGEVFPNVDNRIEQFVSPQSAAWFQALDARVRETGRPVVNQASEVLFKNGIKHWLQLTTVPVPNGEGEVIGFLSVARDISDLKRTESELRTAIENAHQASKAKDQFLAAMSHEIRTPINGIIGASELCQETALDAEQKSYVDTITQCSDTLLALVNDVLDFSKIEAGLMSLEKLNFSPCDTMESVASEFVQTAQTKKLELIVACGEEVPGFVMGDPTRLKQVLYNLVGNAVKFTDKGEVIIRADVRELTEEVARIRFEVSDTGIGIAAARREAIFESFTQADMSTSRKYGGTGLGLAICRKLVELMGGEISVASVENEGASFSFELPFERSPTVGADSVPFNPELSGMRVLIVDDNPTNREIYAQMCAGWGYRSATAADGVSALKLLEDANRKDDRFELILLDQQMPGLNGLDLASLIKMRPDLRELKVILLSSSLDRAESLLADQIGVERALSKPVKRAILLEVILETFEVGESGGDRANSLQQGPGRAPEPLNILLAEDNLVNQKIAKKRLEKLGNQVTVANNGEVALRKAKATRFDGILMDIQMPGMDGYETTAKIREFEAREGVPPQWIIAMTAHALKGDKERCLRAGMDDYIAKPFRVETLKEVLARLDEAKRQASQQADTTPGGSAGSFAQFLESLSSDDREDRLAAAGAFLETLPEEIRKLEQAVESGNAKEIEFTAHNLKSVAGIFGARDSAKLAATLEEMGRHGEAAHSDGKLAQLTGDLSRSLDTLAEEMKAVLAAEGD
ncbi:MAG: response regulator [Opitutales bacterium]